MLYLNRFIEINKEMVKIEESLKLGKILFKEI